MKTGFGAIGAVGVGSLMSKPARVETITVAGGGDALQEAIDTASDDDTIVVSDSADYTPITADVGVTIEADENENPTIVGEGGITGAVAHFCWRRYTIETSPARGREIPGSPAAGAVIPGQPPILRFEPGNCIVFDRFVMGFVERVSAGDCIDVDIRLDFDRYRGAD